MTITIGVSYRFDYCVPDLQHPVARPAPKVTAIDPGVYDRKALVGDPKNFCNVRRTQPERRFTKLGASTRRAGHVPDKKRPRFEIL
jgi:hypothetical protein